MRSLTAAFALALLAAPALAQDFSDDEKAAFIAAMAANDCTMTEDEAEELMPAAGITQDVSGAIAEHLFDRNLATASEDMQRLTLSAEICP